MKNFLKPSSMTASSSSSLERANWALVCLALFSFVVLCGATFLLPQDRYVRYQQLEKTLQFRTVWGYERIVYDPTPIDVAVIGNSRLEAGISAPVLGHNLTAALGRRIHVANLAMPQEGRNAHYTVLKNLLDHRPEVKLVVISVIEQMARESHPAFRNLADPSEFVPAPLLLNTAYFTDLLFQPYRQMSVFVQSLWPGPFGVRRQFVPGRYAGTDLDTTLSFDSPEGSHVDRDQIHTRSELELAAKERISGIHHPFLPPWAARYEFAEDRHYTEAMAALARAHHVRVVFVFAPVFDSGEYVAEAAYYRQFGSILDGRFLANEPSNYSDYGHLNRVGSARFTGWLAGQIGRQLATAGNIGTSHGS